LSSYSENPESSSDQRERARGKDLCPEGQPVG
jgi:hypothetical protein